MTRAMSYRPLGRSGLQVSPLCLGTMMFGGATSEDEARHIIAAARDGGINFIDTADVYCDGESERITGRAIAAHRDWWVLATKLANATGPGPNARGLSRRYAFTAVDASRQRLAVDSIDILYLHKEDHATPLEEVVHAMADLVRLGRIRHFGVSNHRAWRVAEICRLCDAAGIDRPVVSQPYYNALNRMPEVEHLPACAHLGLGVFPYSPLARGVLTGKYHPDAAPDETSRAGRADKRMMETEWRPESLRIAQTLAEHARGRGITPGQFALSWVLNNRLVTGAIAGPRTMAQWDDYMGALDYAFDPEDEALVDGLVTPGHPSTPGYNDPAYPLEGPGQPRRLNAVSDTMTVADEAAVAPRPWLIAVLATACGAGAANLYYAQPLVGLIGPAIGLGLAASGLVVTVTQLGYAAGLFLLVPLGDLLENRRLIAATLAVSVLGLAAAAVSGSAAMFLAASLLIGVSSVGVQMLIPLAAHLTPPEMRGRVVGSVMSGLLLGILLARPVASLMAAGFGWRAVFAASAVLMAGIDGLLLATLPRRRPQLGASYGRLLASLWPLLRDTPVLQRRTLYQSAQFACFALFWTAAPLRLAAAPFHMGQTGIALFALAGAGGALAAPLAGRLADAGWTRPGTGLAIAAVAAAFALSRLGGEGHNAVLLLTAAAVLLDFGVQSSMVFGQRAIYALPGEQRSRLNGIYIGIFFGGGAIGSALAGPALAHDGWRAVTWLGMAVPAAALLVYATEFLPSRRP